MARKKRSSRKTKKRVVRKKSAPNSKFINITKKIAVVINNLFLFVILSLISFIAYKFLPTFIRNDFLMDFFFVMVMVFGFVAVGFLIVLLVLFIMKLVSRK